MRTYSWKGPRAFEGDEVWARSHDGALRRGHVCLVETRYNHRHEAYHTYAVHFEGFKRARWIGDDQLQEILPAVTSHG